MSGDQPLLERAVTNLLDNAAKWSPAGGTVSVAARRRATLERRRRGPRHRRGGPAARLRAVLPLRRGARRARLRPGARDRRSRRPSGTAGWSTPRRTPGRRSTADGCGSRAPRVAQEVLPTSLSASSWAARLPGGLEDLQVGLSEFCHERSAGSQQCSQNQDWLECPQGSTPPSRTPPTRGPPQRRDPAAPPGQAAPAGYSHTPSGHRDSRRSTEPAVRVGPPQSAVGPYGVPAPERPYGPRPSHPHGAAAAALALVARRLRRPVGRCRRRRDVRARPGRLGRRLVVVDHLRRAGHAAPPCDTGRHVVQVRRRAVLPSVVSIEVVDRAGSGDRLRHPVEQDGLILTNNHVAVAGADGGAASR